MATPKSSERTPEKLLRLLDGQSGGRETVLGRLDAVNEESGAPVHAELLRLLTHLSYSNESARQIWSGFEVHRVTLQRRLGRDAGARVALFDYLSNVDRRLNNPTIIELAAYERTEKAAITDGLTGLFNRAHFDGCLSREIKRCRRYGQCASILLIDLDDFKRVNDTHGHAAGDSVLRDMGRLLIQRVRDIDVAARYGGEEFAIILPETRRTSAYVVAERIRSEAERYFRKHASNNHGVRITLSGGIAGFPDDGESAEALMARADEALYRAKRSGKNLVRIYFREKRKASRIPVASRGTVIRLSAGRPAEPAAFRAIDISERGIRLQTREPLRLGQSLRIRLPLGVGEDLSLEGEVVRLEERANPKQRRVYDAGIRFSFSRRSVPTDLAQFIRNHQSEGA